ncbi:peptidase T [Oxobacter pfennigii]|uniref:Peptidase T n=1 Tax=Oxobacter pfennigii TaxID=36849 RepID=A0A0P8W908_9CLOT|nr:peptidase T [Oxobacter pfennigii]KPU45140.1 peptidase T [Oxobacter pfennigii]
MEKVVDKFLRYVKYDTQSQEDVEDYPSTEGQLVLLKDLAKELKDLGLRDVTMDEFGYVFATLPSNIQKDLPIIGFIAHTDTSNAMPGKNVNPKITENYDGNDIVLNEKLGILLSPNEFPDLLNYKGDTIISTDGITLLGADDKAGVAEIMTAVEYLVNHPEIKHGTIKVGFTPDEEVGRGVDFFDVKKFGADFAYTVDGGKIGEVEYENFNAAIAKFDIHGKSTHTGSAKGVMVNSMYIASELNMMIPQDETPAATEGYQGFYHLHTLSGNVELTKTSYLLRDFTDEGLLNRKKFMQELAVKLNKKYGEGTVEVKIKDQYSNMVEKVKERQHIVDTAIEAMKEAGVEPLVQPIRGGTDGARLSFMGLPCPNLFTGGHNFHGKYEFIPLKSMEKSVEVILKIIEIYAR